MEVRSSKSVTLIPVTFLKNRGHSFVRYVDDMVIFCGSKASARQTLEHIVPFIEKKLF